MNRKLVENLLRTEDSDPGCEASFARLDQYVEAIIQGHDGTALFPDIAMHLQNCDACREDTEGLLEVLRKNIAADQ